jgi:hypothetical protein
MATIGGLLELLLGAFPGTDRPTMQNGSRVKLLPRGDSLARAPRRYSNKLGAARSPGVKAFAP